jgi:hypothetical protein
MVEDGCRDSSCYASERALELLRAYSSLLRSYFMK